MGRTSDAVNMLVVEHLQNVVRHSHHIIRYPSSDHYSLSRTVVIRTVLKQKPIRRRMKAISAPNLHYYGYTKLKPHHEKRIRQQRSAGIMPTKRVVVYGAARTAWNVSAYLRQEQIGEQ